MKTIAVIPARFNASRFPGKPLALLKGKPMIQWVYEVALSCEIFDDVVVATDDTRIRDTVFSFGGKVEMTDPGHLSGTERLAEVARRSDADIFVNVQGDEPLIEKAAIQAAVALVKSGKFEIGSAVTRLKSITELESRTVVKALFDKNGRALYFTRFPIPYSRQEPPASPSEYIPWRHLGLYVYGKATLLKIATLPPSSLELGESLEQLRAMENGISIGLAQVESDSFGIDTPEDMQKAEAYLDAQSV